MAALADLFGEGSPVPDYLARVTAIHSDVYASDLAGLYLHGSAVQGDFHPGSSDIDVLGVVDGKVSPEQRDELVARLRHETLAVPAHGLELILCTADAVTSPVAEMPYEFALSTGIEWGTQTEVDGTTSDLLVNMELCRQAAFALAGPPAQDVLAAASRADLRKALIGELEWHLRDLEAAKGEQPVINATLNAARSLYAARTGEILSKTQGGRWWLNQHPDDSAVAQARAARLGDAHGALSASDAADLARRIIAEIAAMND